MQTIGTKAKEIELDGARWMLNPLPAWDALEVLLKIGGIAGGAVQRIEGDGPEDKMLSVIGGIFVKLAEPGAVPIIKKLLATLHKNDAPVNFERDFAEDPFLFLDLTKWAVMINYEKSLKKSAIAKQIMALMAAGEKSTSATSTGASGAPSLPANAH